uniref:Uncharacterized protein n=1 Tax=Triticum urartu TaxID=4572 RepID=A0A8R7VCT3_TRIUA
MERREGRIGTARLPTAGPTMAPVTGSVAPRLPVSSQDGPAGRCPDGRVCAIHGTHLLHPGPPPQHRRGHYFVRTDYHNDAQVLGMMVERDEKDILDPHGHQGFKDIGRCRGGNEDGDDCGAQFK